MNLSVRDAAGLLKVSEKTIYRWIQQQVVPAYRVQEQYRFNRAELLEWATSRRLNVSSEIFFEPEAEGLPIPTLVAALEAGGVHYRVSGSDKAGALSRSSETASPAGRGGSRIPAPCTSRAGGHCAHCHR